MRKNLFVAFYSIVLTLFTVYVILDTFVIARVYVDDVHLNQEIKSTYEKENETSEKTNVSNYDSVDTEVLGEEPQFTENSYSDQNISIVISEHRVNETTVYVADVKLKSAEYLKTAFARGAYGKNLTEKTSQIAEVSNAIFAVNGDFYGARERGYVIRNGVLYRDVGSASNEDLVIYCDGSFEIVLESEVVASDLQDAGAMHVLSFGPALINNGEICVGQKDEVGKSMSSNPRTAVGIIDSLHYVFVVSDGRTRESEGLSLYELADFIKTLGATVAYNLDGGGSSTMVFNGRVINNPTTNGRNISERKVSDILYIGY